jgi:stearoyl-CoA desaturase (delta-9 desaturase)
MVLSIGTSERVTDRYSFFERSKKLDKNKNSVAKRPGDWEDYIYVPNGFFDIVFLPYLPMLIAHFMTYMYGLYTILAGQVMMNTVIASTCFAFWSGFGGSCGAHRLWCHRAYKAKWPLRVFLMIGQTISTLNHIYTWVLVHRTHHKFSDTDADPHNVSRGFVFCHMGWVVKREHPLVKIKSETVNCDDVMADPIARFQYKFYYPLYALFGVAMPCAFNYYIVGDTLFNSFLIGVLVRSCVAMHATAFVNSAAHMFGDKPYNNKINSSENSIVAYGCVGEGYHNYHHAYPWDYGIGEQGNWFNLGKLFLDIMYSIGQAYSLKQASPEMIMSSREKAKLKKCDFESTY